MTANFLQRSYIISTHNLQHNGSYSNHLTCLSHGQGSGPAATSLSPFPPAAFSGQQPAHCAHCALHNLPHLAKPSKFGLNGLSEPINEMMVPEVPFLVLTKAGEF